ncbi:MAG: 5-formyltetrahydrofolate cyclo-ligase [Gammaproteobacteria bacterium]|jgi:5-formyltetrahydrofolate cyclo-ligase
MPSSNSLIRSRKRQLRNQLTAREQSSHATALCSQIRRLSAFLNSRRIACYLANDGEIDPKNIIQTAWNLRKQVYLPVLSPFQSKLYFAPYSAGMDMHINRFGIREPACRPVNWLTAWQLDLMLLPLVAFDENGNRLGMGGGFYDRSLAYRHSRIHSLRPKLIGLAHELQREDKLATNSWDIPLDLIATEQRIIKGCENCRLGP